MFETQSQPSWSSFHSSEFCFLEVVGNAVQPDYSTECNYGNKDYVDVELTIFLMYSVTSLNEPSQEWTIFI